MFNFDNFVSSPSGDRFGLYVSEPAVPNGRAVIVLQEIFGVNSAMRTLTDKFAEAGYLAVAPDLFWRFGAGIELGYTRADTLQAIEMMKGYKVEDGVSDTLATVRYLRERPGLAKVSTVGLCLGGLLSYKVAAHGVVDAAVAFYATDIVKSLDELPQIRCPISIHYGEVDRFIPLDQVERVSLALTEQRKGDVFVYPDAEHGFYTRGSEANRALAHTRVLDFLDKTL